MKSSALIVAFFDSLTKSLIADTNDITSITTAPIPVAINAARNNFVATVAPPITNVYKVVAVDCAPVATLSASLVNAPSFNVAL